MSVLKTKKLLEKSQVPNEDLMLSVDRAIRAQEMTEVFFREDRKLKEIDLKELVTTLEHSLSIHISLEPESLTKITFIERDLCNILVNLIKNAKEANASTIHPWVKIKVLLEGGMYKFWITDSGAYKNIENPDEILKVGYSTKSASGRGIGLYSVKNLVEKHHGQIKITNNMNHTCFSIELMKR